MSATAKSSSKKSPDAFRTISEAAAEIGVQQHVLRHWESLFPAVKPMRRGGGRRFYRLNDIHLLNGIRFLLHEEKYTTKGVQKIFKSQGVKSIVALGQIALEKKNAPKVQETNIVSTPHISGQQKIKKATFIPVKKGQNLQEAEQMANTPQPSFSPEAKMMLKNMLADLKQLQDELDEARLALSSIKQIDS